MVNIKVSRANEKLGGIPSFSLPVYETCPGKTLFCDLYCYADKGRLAWKRTIKNFWLNLRESKQWYFTDTMIDILCGWENVFRLHVSGDFYSVGYIEKWVAIAKESPDTVFFGSTRSWRIKELNEALRELVSLPNVYLRASIDFTHTDRPDPWWSTWGVMSEGESCPHDLDLVEHCITCGKCFNDKDTNMTFNLRWGNKYVNLSPGLFEEVQHGRRSCKV